MTINLSEHTLSMGSHASLDQGACLMELVSAYVGGPYTDYPPCVAPLLSEMGRSLNDIVPDDLRQELVPLIPALVNTAEDGHDKERAYMALDWLIRTWLPTWLELSPACRDDAVRLREVGRITNRASAQHAEPVVRQARSTVVAMADACTSRSTPFWADAWPPDGEAAAWAAAYTCENTTVWADAEAAAWAAAWLVDWDMLAPTIRKLQQSAIELFGRMAHVGQEARS